MHKKDFSMRPILSATDTYNYNLAKWLDDKLKPLSTNEYTINDVFKFAGEIRDMEFVESDILVSYDVSSLFTNVPLDETIQILVDKAFSNNWFNTTYELNITKSDLSDLLKVATKDQLFQFNGNLYEQVDGVAMGSPLGLLLANTFMCYIEERLQQQGKIPAFYRRYVDDTLTAVPDVASAQALLETLNNAHQAINFTMELPKSDTIPFLGMNLSKKGCKIVTSTFIKPTDTGLLTHYHSHIDRRYKTSLLRTIYIVVFNYPRLGAYS